MASRFDFTSRIAKDIPEQPPWGSGPRPSYNFGVGFLDPETFPSEGLHEALGRALKELGSDLVLYPHVQGLLSLRELIAEKLEQHRGMQVDPEQIIITPGSTQAIVLFTQIFTNPGDTIITEQFTHSGTLNIMNRFHANIVGVGMDEEGMRPDALDQTIVDLRQQGQEPKFIFTIPTFQNPVGTDMGVQRRQDILEVAQRRGVPIYEDDCYVDLRFSGDASPAIYSYDRSDMVLYSGSFSKIVGPGMRLGWLVAPKELVPRLSALNLGASPSQFAALATLYYLRDHMEEHLSELCSTLAAKRDTMLAALGESMGAAVDSTHPEGGLYLWLHLPEGANVAAALDKARQRGVTFGPGTSFSPSRDAHNYLRLCFGYYDHQDIRDGVALLADVFAEEGLLA